jgi:SAM-dependent methyltransferase
MTAWRGSGKMACRRAGWNQTVTEQKSQADIDSAIARLNELARLKAAAAEPTRYEQRQGSSRLLTWVHSLRYRHVVRLLKDLPQPIRVLEIGCDSGRLYDTLKARYDIRFTGIDVAEGRVIIARERYRKDPNFRARIGSAADLLPFDEPYDVIVALETFEHIAEPDVLTILAAIAKMAPRRFICSVPVEIGPAVFFKNLTSALTGYIRHRDYTWRDTFWAALYRLDKIPVHNRRHIGFDWRWLAYSVRLFLPMMKRRNLPFWFLPAALSNSVLLVAERTPPTQS